MSDLLPEAKHKEIANCPILAMENASLERRIAELDALARNVLRHRDVPCAESPKCMGGECQLGSHNNLVAWTAEARDDLDALRAALKGGSDTPNVSYETPSVSEGGSDE